MGVVVVATYQALLVGVHENGEGLGEGKLISFGAATIGISKLAEAMMGQDS
jgi:hypothetical protein